MADLYQFNFEMNEAEVADNKQNYGMDHFYEQYYNDAAVTKLENFEKDNPELAELEAKIAAEQKACDYDPSYPRTSLNTLEEQFAQKFNNSFAGTEISSERIYNLVKTFQKVKALNNPNLDKNFEFLSSFAEASRDKGYAENNGMNVSRLQLKTDANGNSRLLMVMKNLGGTGLDFTIEDGRSIVFAKDAKLTREQVQQFARFFADNGMNINDFSNLSDINVLENDGQSQAGSFEDIFTKEKQGYARDAELDGMQSEASTEAEPAAEASGEYRDYIEAANKPMDVSLKKMKGSALARAGIMRYSKNLLKTMRMADGSYCICGYSDANAMLDDNKMDKDGHVKRTKDWAIRMYPTTPPSCKFYLKPGAEFKSSHAKMVLGTFKATGCAYFTMPPTTEVGGSTQKAFWEAAGDQLMCPRLKRTKDDDGIPGFGNDHLQVVLKAIKDKGASDVNDVILFKMRLVEEIEAQAAYEGKMESNLATSLAGLKGDIKFTKFNSSYKGMLEKFVNEGVRDQNWNTADLASAYVAMGEVIKAIESGVDSQGKPLNYKFIEGKDGNNAEKLHELMIKEMARARPKIDKEIQEQAVVESKGKLTQEDLEDADNLEEANSANPLSRAGDDILRKKVEQLSSIVVADMKENYGESADFKFSMVKKAAALTKDNMHSMPRLNDKDRAAYTSARTAAPVRNTQNTGR